MPACRRYGISSWRLDAIDSVQFSKDFRCLSFWHPAGPAFSAQVPDDAQGLSDLLPGSCADAELVWHVHIVIDLDAQGDKLRLELAEAVQDSDGHKEDLLLIRPAWSRASRLLSHPLLPLHLR